MGNSELSFTATAPDKNRISMSSIDEFSQVEERKYKDFSHKEQNFESISIPAEETQTLAMRGRRHRAEVEEGDLATASESVLCIWEQRLTDSESFNSFHE